MWGSAVPSLADLALRAGDFPAVVVDAEVVAGVALLGAMLAGAVARQRPGQGDLMLAPSLLRVHQGSATSSPVPGTNVICGCRSSGAADVHGRWLGPNAAGALADWARTGLGAGWGWVSSVTSGVLRAVPG